FFQLAEERALEDLNFSDVRKHLLDALEDRLGTRMTQMTALLVREAQLLGTRLKPIERTDVAIDGHESLLTELQGGDYFSAHVRQTPVASDLGPVFERRRIHAGPIRLDLAAPTAGKELVQDRAASRERELQDEGLFIRGQVGPKIGVARPTSAVG